MTIFMQQYLDYFFSITKYEIKINKLETKYTSFSQVHDQNKHTNVYIEVVTVHLNPKIFNSIKAYKS
jgi:hypothetical protein